MRTMPPARAASSMQQILDNSQGDIEVAHIHAGKLVRLILTENGFEETATIFEKIERWYA